MLLNLNSNNKMPYRQLHKWNPMAFNLVNYEKGSNMLTNFIPSIYHYVGLNQ